MRELAGVWKGTAEEKARVRFVEGLAKMAEEKMREVERERSRGRGRGVSVAKSQQGPAKEQTGGRGGFLEGLGRIRGFVE